MPLALGAPRLSLRAGTPANARWNLEVLGEHEGGTALTLAEAQRRLDEQNRHAHQGGFDFFALDRRVEGIVIGCCGLPV